MPVKPEKIVLASGNPGKVAEIARILADLEIEVVPQSEFGVTDADETGTTFAENALIKAQHAVDATGLPAIADDSGICVDALDGRLTKDLVLRLDVEVFDDDGAVSTADRVQVVVSRVDCGRLRMMVEHFGHAQVKLALNVRLRVLQPLLHEHLIVRHLVDTQVAIRAHY